MNILLERGLPEEYQGTPISTDFRNMIRADLILHDPDLSESEKSFLALSQLYEEIPDDVETAEDGFEWFFLRGKTDEAVSGRGTKKAPAKSFDFEQDAEIIYSAFYATYNISLSTVDFLHWWEFMALFEGLPDTTLIKRVMYWRTAELQDLSKAEKKHVLKMRKLFALKRPEKERLSVEQIEQNTKDEIARRYEEAERWAREQAGEDN